MNRYTRLMPCHGGLTIFGFVLILALCLVIAACGGSMGSDPSSSTGDSGSASSGSAGGSASDPSGASSTPTATNGSLASVMGAAGTGTLSGQGSGTLTYAISTPPQNGTATLTNASTGAFTYTSYPNFVGQDSFQFTVTDSGGTSQPATETLNVTSPAIGAKQTVANIGVNLDSLCYWCTAQPFVDIVHQATPFQDITTGWFLGEEGKLDANGWPEADFHTMIACCIGPDGGASDSGTTSPLIGKYQISFHGIAKIGDDGGTVEDQQYDPATNTTTTATLDQVPTNSDGSGFDMLLYFASTQRTAQSAVNTGITNLAIIRPQFAPNGMKWWDSPTQEFTDPFLDSLKGFSTVRYLDWTGAIDSPEINWADRTPDDWPVSQHYVVAAPSALSYVTPPAANCTQYCDWYPTGSSWQSVIDVSNASHTDPWINIPVMASDDYVKSLAALFKAKLDPGLHVYVEWSDEIWNYAYPWWTETNFNRAQMNAEIANNPTAANNYSANCYSYNPECHVAERVMQFAQDFASVYGQAAINTTIRPVLCEQFVSPGFLQAGLRFIALTYGPPKNYFYGICGAPYWGAASALPAGTTATGAVAAIDAGIPANDGFFRTDTATALFYGLHNLTYEGGPVNTRLGVDGDTSGKAAQALEASVQMAPGMKNDVIDGLTNAFANGVDMYMYYQNESATYWGATTDPLDLQAPKFAGLTTATGQLVTRSVGTSLPGTIPVIPVLFQVSGGNIGSAYNLSCNLDSCTWIGGNAKGDGIGFLVNVPKAGSYTFSTVMDPYEDKGGSLTLQVDQTPVATFTVPPKPSNTPLTLGPATVTLTAGLHLVELVDAIGKSNFSVDSIIVTDN